MIFYYNRKESAKSKIFDFFPFGRILKQNLYFYFNPIDNVEKGNWEAILYLSTMLKSVQRLSLFVSDVSQKIENWKLKSISNFWFSAKTFQIIDRTTLKGRGGVHWHGSFLPPAPLPTVPLPSLTGKSRILFADFPNVWGTFCEFSAFSSLSSVHYSEQRDLRREPKRKRSLSFYNWSGWCKHVGSSPNAPYCKTAIGLDRIALDWIWFLTRGFAKNLIANKIQGRIKTLQFPWNKTCWAELNPSQFHCL